MANEGNAYLGSERAQHGVNDYSADDFHIQQALNELSTATLVKIVKAPYDENGNDITPGDPVPIGYIDVLPLVNQLDGYGNPTQHQTVHRLKYHRYQGGYGAFITDPKIGDVGKMVVADRDTSVVRKTGTQGNPGSRRKFDKADGTYFGQAVAGAPTQYFSWLSQGFKLVDAFGNTLLGTNKGVYINGALITLAGDVIAKNGVSLENHTHPQPPDSHGDTEQDTNPPNPGTPP